MAGVSGDASATTNAHKEPKERKKGWKDGYVDRKAGKMVMLTKCLPHKHEHLNSTSSTHIKVSSLVVNTCNPRAWMIKTGRSQGLGGGW